VAKNGRTGKARTPSLVRLSSCREPTGSVRGRVAPRGGPRRRRRGQRTPRPFSLRAPSTTPEPSSHISPRFRVGVGSVSNNQIMFSCVKCMAFPAERSQSGKMLCRDCREREAAPEERRERKARIAGRQPMICEQCEEPFLASRLGHRYCSSTLPLAGLAGPASRHQRLGPSRLLGRASASRRRRLRSTGNGTP